MRVPQIVNIHHELRLDVPEQIVAMVMFVNVAFNVCSFLKEKVGIRCNCLSSIDLSLADQFSAAFTVSWVSHDDLERLGVMHANVAFRTPLTLILVEIIEVTGGVVKEDGLRREAIQDLGRFKL